MPPKTAGGVAKRSPAAGAAAAAGSEAASGAGGGSKRVQGASAAAAASPRAPSMLAFVARKPRGSASGSDSPAKAAKPSALQPAPPAAPLPPPPLPLPRSADAADEVCGHLGAEYEVRDAGEHGRGLFVIKALPAGSIIARYDGVAHDSRTVPEGAARTHMLRLRNCDQIMDGLPLASGLQRRPDGTYWPARPAEAVCGYASLANSVPTEREANAKLVFLKSYALPGAPKPVRRNRDLAELLPPGAFLVAKRLLKPGEEVLWRYQVAF